jgi:hypothetical protein
LASSNITEPKTMCLTPWAAADLTTRTPASQREQPARLTLRDLLLAVHVAADEERAVHVADLQARGVERLVGRLHVVGGVDDLDAVEAGEALRGRRLRVAHEEVDCPGRARRALVVTREGVDEGRPLVAGAAEDDNVLGHVGRGGGGAVEWVGGEKSEL